MKNIPILKLIRGAEATKLRTGKGMNRFKVERSSLMKNIHLISSISKHGLWHSHHEKKANRE